MNMAIDQMLKELLQENIRTWDLQYRVHATRRMFQRNFVEADLFSCLDNGTIIEEYKDDMPFPSMLINGLSISGRAMHVVAGIDADLKRLYIITVYEPDPVRWNNNFSRRVLL